ncbi:MAG: hypothetical protein WCX64_00640 [Candidatus Micrarchaeia archaeon]
MAIQDMLSKLNPKSGDQITVGDSVAPAGKAPSEKNWDIQMTSVPADAKEPMMKLTNRYNYTQSYLPLWKEALRFRSYSLVLALIGVVTLMPMPVVGVAALFGASYYHMQGEFRKDRLTSGRKVMWGQ